MKAHIQGTGPAVLLLHGIPTGGRLWDYVVANLRHRLKCVVVDLPGMGESPPLADGSLAPERFAEELESLREQLAIPSWHVAGHDAGSTIGVHYAVKFGERVGKLVLCSPPIFPELRPPLAFRLLRTPLIGDCLAPIVTPALWRVGMQSAIARQNQSTEEIIQSFRQPFAGFRGARRFLRLLRWGDPAQVLASTAALLPSIAAPTLILHGRHDGTIPVSFATRAAALIPNAEMQLLDSGHFLPLNCPAELSRRLLTFFGISPPRKS